MQICHTTTINDSSEKLWQTLRAFDEVERYLSIVTKSVVEGNGKGSKRTCDLNLGTQRFQTVETLEILDDSNHLLIVSLDEGPIQIKGMKFTFVVKSQGEHKSDIIISTDVGNPDAASMVNTIFDMIGQGLKRFHEE